MDQKKAIRPVEALPRQPSRRAVIKSGTTAALALSVAPGALAAARSRFPASGEVVLTFDVTPAAEGSDLS